MQLEPRLVLVQCSLSISRPDTPTGILFTTSRQVTRLEHLESEQLASWRSISFFAPLFLPQGLVRQLAHVSAANRRLSEENPRAREDRHPCFLGKLLSRSCRIDADSTSVDLRMQGNPAAILADLKTK